MAEQYETDAGGVLTRAGRAARTADRRAASTAAAEKLAAHRAAATDQPGVGAANYIEAPPLGVSTRLPEESWTIKVANAKIEGFDTVKEHDDAKAQK